MKFSPLDRVHRLHGAKMVEFGGWEMPVSYPTGTIVEHLTCRQSAVVFDVSHLGTVRVEGYYAKAALQDVFSNDLDKIAAGRAQYTHLLNEDGGVEDDIIIWWVSPDRFDVMPNASNTQRVIGAIGGVDVTATRAVLAVQGPKTRELLQGVSSEFAAVPKNRVASISWNGIECVVAGTGYTGEVGVEIAVPVDAAEKLWNEISAAGIIPCGLGARDTLRLEAGLPLHGHELSGSISPLQAGLGWVVAWGKPGFIGKAALQAQRLTGIEWKILGFETPEKRPPREGCDVFYKGTKVGVTTSGNFSPCLQHGIGFALVDATLQLGDQITVLVRGNSLTGKIVKTPFVSKAG